MSGSREDPFLESQALCAVCLDLKKENLRRQWRQFGRLFPMEAPYSFTLKRLSDQISLTDCNGCRLIYDAAQEISKELGLRLKNVELEFVDKEHQQALSLTLMGIHPWDTEPGDLEKAQSTQSMRVDVHTGPSEAFPDREWVHRISSPAFELFRYTQKNEEEAPAADSVCSGLLPQPSRCGNTGSDEACMLTRENIENCRSNHPQCNRVKSGWGLPTRVLDLGEKSTELKSDIKLYVTDKEEEDYVCLSHCWGTNKGLRPLETTTQTLQDFEQCIPYDLLPATFQDAVVFTRKLGYRFLWIDSLCIVQDDAQDWANEAAQMADIYESAVLTLAAASSAHSGGGLFRKSTPHICLENPQWNEPKAALRQLCNREFFEYDQPAPKRAKSGANAQSPLFSRAWVFQERMLSRRTVFFTPLELVFECREGNVTETGYSWMNSEPKLTFSNIYTNATPQGQLVLMWRGLVENFTQLQLSFEKDTLAAMAGFASRFLQRSEGSEPNRYFAGLWKETFIDDMLWEVSSHQKSRLPRINSGVPSWSWAHSDWPKKYGRQKALVYLCQLDKAECSFRGSADPLIGVDSGHAILSGYLLAAEMRPGGLVIEHHPRVQHIPERDYPWFGDGPKQIQTGEKLFILPLTASLGDLRDGGAVINALVLRPCFGSENSFTRIGIFSIALDHLRGHEHIFEGADIALTAYQRLVSFGQSLLGDDDLYIKKAEDYGTPLWLASKLKMEETSFLDKARYRHLCDYGPKAVLGFDKYFGKVHFNAVTSDMEAEQERIHAWIGRNDEGRDQLHRKTSIHLI